MNDAIVYGLNIEDPVSKADAPLRVDQDELSAISGIYNSATTVDTQPLLPSTEDSFIVRNVIPNPNVASGSVSSGFTAQTLDIVQSDNTAGTRIFLTKAT